MSSLRAFFVILTMTVAVATAPAQETSAQQPAAPASEAQQAEEMDTVRVSDLGKWLGQEVTVKGRSGVIVESEATEEIGVFTLRDDYGDQVHVRSAGDYPIMGATWYVTGIPRADSGTGVVYVEESSRSRAYKPPPPPPAEQVLPAWLLPLIGGLGLLVILIVVKVVRGHRATATLAPPWGYAEIVGGPDQGKVFALRGEEVLVGRVQDPATGIALPLDTNVSRDHGRILRQGEDVFYEDTGSINGSWVHEQQANSGQRVPLSPGVLVRLGPATVLRVGEAGDATATVRAGDEVVGGNWGEAPTERAPEE